MDDRSAQSPQPPEPDLILCPHCIEPVGPFDHFCPHCAGPVTAHASIDPLGQVFAAGRAYQNATSASRSSASTSRACEEALSSPSSGFAGEGRGGGALAPDEENSPFIASRRSLIITLGMWLIFFPQIIILFGALLMQVWSTTGVDLTAAGLPSAPTTDLPLNNAVGALAAIAILTLYIAILWKVTWRTR